MGKKIVSLLLIGHMIILTLTGCNTNELGFLNLSKEIETNTQYKFTNSTELVISSTVAREDYNINLELKGEANIDDLNSMYMNFDVMLKVNEIENEQPINFVITDNKVYVSKNAILETVKLKEKLDGTKENSKVIDYLYNEELKDAEYILIADLNEYYNGVQYKANSKEINDSALDYIKAAFKNFDTKLVKKSNNGYAIELTPKNAFVLIERLIKYVDENKEQVFDETIKYIEKIYDQINVTDLEGLLETDKQAAIDEFKESRQNFYDFIEEAVLFIKTDEFKAYENMFNRSTLKEEIYKKGSSYIQKVEGELVFQDIIMGNLKTSTEIIPVAVEQKQITGMYLSIDELESLYYKTENKINPVNKIELSWYPENDNAEINKYRLDGKTDWDYKNYALIEDRVYLPLRYIGESFEEDVQWDNELKKAYIIRSGEKIDMTGVLIDNTTMVKVRDFEKLGYKIGFVQVEQVKDAGNFFLEIMPVMFIPAAVGLITVWKDIVYNIIPILIITILTTVLVMVATGKMTDFILKKDKG